MVILSQQLKNGIRLVHCQHKSHVAHCGLIINTGSRDETGHPQGIAHFIEHMLFKGTKRRKTREILSRIDEVGGELNAYTSKENTFIYASFLAEYFERSIDIITDIAFHSTFPAKEIVKEKAVIIDEINSYKDDPSEDINDRFDELLFINHPLGNNILGTIESVNSIEQKDINKFIQRLYNTDQMVFCYLGPLSSDKFFKVSKKYFEEIPENLRIIKRKKCFSNKSLVISEIKNTNTCHCIIGNKSYGLKSKNRLPFFLLNNILGGPGLNSRLNMNIREKYGFTYMIDSTYTPYEDTGEWSIYMATDKRNLNKTIELVYKELEILKKNKLSPLQLSKAKRQLKGQLSLANENSSALIHVIAKSYLLFNEFESLEKIFKQIDTISSEQLQEIANEIFDKEKLTQLTYIN